MAPKVHLDYRSRPSALAYMAGALHPSPGFDDVALPAISAHWRQHRADARALRDFLRLSGLAGPQPWALLYPHTISFPLQMAILTHKAFPAPIWRVLQVRNQLLQIQQLDLAAPLDLSVRTVAQRFLDKGAEVDLHTVASSAAGAVWESLNTFYVRGRFGQPSGAAQPPAAPDAGSAWLAHWRMPVGGGWRFGALSGDYNGIHLFDGYARRLGFAHAFFHPQRVLGHCLARLAAPEPARPLRLDAWLKGPVFYGAAVGMRATVQPDATVFALHVDQDQRPALVGRISQPDAGSRLQAGAFDASGLVA
jgi:hypothetical protein